MISNVDPWVWDVCLHGHEGRHPRPQRLGLANVCVNLLTSILEKVLCFAGWLSECAGSRAAPNIHFLIVWRAVCIHFAACSLTCKAQYSGCLMICMTSTHFLWGRTSPHVVKVYTMLAPICTGNHKDDGTTPT